MTCEEILSAYAEGVRDFGGANLRGANLRNADLRNADLSGAELIGANLIGANLVGANLVGAELVGAELIGANLIGANLIGANLRSADLRDADLRGADLRGADLIGAYLSDANLRSADLPSPTIFILANWGEVSEKLCEALMRFDASNHDDPLKFQEWAEGGECPYNGELYQRSSNFSQKKEVYRADAILLTARQLMQCLLFEKCKYYDEGETE